MKSFSDSVIEYKKQLDKGDIQIACRVLLEYMMGLKYFFKNKYPDFDDPEALTRQIESGTLKFIKDIKELIKET